LSLISVKKRAMENKQITILGGGSWATAIVKMLCNNCDKVNWWIRSQDDVDFIQENGHNPKYLTDVAFDRDQLNVSTDIRALVEMADIVIIVIPSAFLHNAVEGLTDLLKDKIVFSAVKGIIPEYNQIIGDYLNEFHQVPLDNIGVITGPCHAEEVALERLSYLTLACTDLSKAECLGEKLASTYIKVNISDDIYGTEISAVLKNVFAIASGICHGLGYGDNFMAVLISNAIRETKRFVDAVHPIERDIKDSAYLGDLLVTAYSNFSRNRIFGTMLGKGYSVKAAQMDMNMIAEGYYSVKCVHAINEKYGVKMPITDAVYNVVYRKISPRVEMRLLTDELD